MRPALIAVAAVALAAVAAPARADVPVVLAERQLVTLEFAQPVARLAVTDLDVVQLEADGSRVRITGLRGGHTGVQVLFADGAAAAFDVRVEGAVRAAKPAAAP